MRPDLVVLIRCLHCRHQSVLSAQALAGYGLKPDAPIAAFVKRLRCSRCGSGSVMASRVGRKRTCRPPSNARLGRGTQSQAAHFSSAQATDVSRRIFPPDFPPNF